MRLFLCALLVFGAPPLEAQTLTDRIVSCVNDTKDALDCALEIAPSSIQKSVGTHFKDAVERSRRYNAHIELTAHNRALFLIPSVFSALAAEFLIEAKRTRGDKKEHFEMLGHTSQSFAFVSEVIAEGSMSSEALLQKLHTLKTPHEVRETLNVHAHERLESTTRAQTLFRKGVLARTIAHFPNTCRDEHSCDSILDDLITDKLLHWSISLEETRHVLHVTATNDLKALIRIRELQ